MNKPKRTQIIMGSYSAWSASVAVVLLSVSMWGYSIDPLAGNEMLYLMVLALFHGIFAIWFWEGRRLPHFIRATIYARVFLGGAYWLSVWQVSRWGGVLDLPAYVVNGYIIYLVIQGCADILGALCSAVNLSGIKALFSPVQEHELNTKWDLEIKNRFAFAVYMVFLGAWILVSTEGFLAFFYLPETEFSDPSSPGQFVPGPLHLIGVLVWVLAAYNFIAIKHRLTQLITAGVRGGLFTCVFVLLLVLAGVLHPITLLLPAVDLISVGVILIYRAARMLKPA